MLFVWDRLPVVIVAVATALALWATGVLDLDQALAGFGDPRSIFIASLFVVSAGLDATGVTAWAGHSDCAGGRRAGRGCSSDDAARRPADRADQRQRRRRGAPAASSWSWRSGSAARPRSCSCRSCSGPRRLAAGAHRHAGERARVRGCGGRRPGAVRLLRVRAVGIPLLSGPSRSSCCSGSACCPIGTAGRSRPTSATRPDAHRAVHLDARARTRSSTARRAWPRSSSRPAPG